MVRVLIADDHEPFLTAADGVVAATPGFELVALARSGEDALTLALATTPDLVVVDINMPGLGGIEAVRRIVAALPAVRAVLVSTYAEPQLPAAARTCGASYLHKQEFGPAALAALAAS